MNPPVTSAMSGPHLASARLAPQQQRRPPARAELSPWQSRALVAVIAALHVLLVWALLQVPAVRQAVLEAAPVFVDLLPPDKPPAPPPPRPRPMLQRTPPLIVSKAAPAPAATFVVEPTPVEPVVVSPAPQVQVETAPPAPAAPAPKVIPPSGVQYLVPPPLEYPRVSRRLAESGRVMVRVYIDEDGLPRQVQVTQSSGHARLDEAAVAAVHKARFKPYTEHGRPTPGWAFIPLTFDLEK